ncbi:MAG: hypothetical protein HQ553_13200 [Chloroflexi bacterium]|nr:hypothetical protein [Chloroflexota bacterium]
MISCSDDDSSENNIQTSFGGITLLDHSISSCMDNPELPCTVSGNARNDAGFMFSMVTVKVSFLDENGETVTTGIAAVENLKRGREFDFAVETLLEDFQTDKYDIDIVTKH